MSLEFDVKLLVKPRKEGVSFKCFPVSDGGDSFTAGLVVKLITHDCNVFV